MEIEPSRPTKQLGIAEILTVLGIKCSDGEESEPYLAIPGNYGPRWLIPEKSRASISVLDAWRPYRISAQAKWLAMRLAARAGALRHLPSITRIAVSRAKVLQWQQRCGIQSQSAEMVVLVGNPSPDSKLITFLLNDAGQIAAVLKVGVTAGGGRSILYEAEVLDRLKPYCWAPDLLSIHPDLHAATQEYVYGAMPCRTFHPEYLDLLCRLPRYSDICLSAVAKEMSQRLSPYRCYLDKLAPRVLDKSLSYLDRDVTVPTLLVHGDFAPWNLRCNPIRGYVLVDWEWAKMDGLPAYDLLHFQFTDYRLFGGKNGCYHSIRSNPIHADYFSRMDLDISLLPYLSVAYLLDQLEAHCRGRGPLYIADFMRELASIVN
jgi:hypothetical protein